MTVSVKYNPNNGLFQVNGGDGVDFGSSPTSGNFVGKFTGIMSGSHTALADGTAAFIAGANMTINEGSNGALTFLAGSSVGVTPALGRVVIVDDINGNDSTGTINGSPFKTVQSALSYIATNALTYITVWIMPGTYTLTSGITVPASCSMRGMSLQSCILTYDAFASSTMITVNEHVRIEDLTINMTSSSATANLTAISLVGSASVTSRVRVCTITVDNSSVSASSTTNVYGIYAGAAGDNGTGSFAMCCLRGTNVNVLSNGGGLKTALYVSGTDVNLISTTDTNLYVAHPIDSSSIGTYVGAYSDNRKGSLYLRSAAISGPVHTSLYTNTSVKIACTTNVTATAPQTLQEISLVVGDRVLLTGQTSAINNGIWVVQSGAWTRATDMAAGSNASSAFVLVDDGDYYAQKFLCISLTATVGTNSLIWISTTSAFDLKPPVYARYVGGSPSGALAAQGTYTPVTGDRIFLDQATNAVNSGIWVYNSAGAWTRSLEMSAGTSALNAHIFVYSGTYANTAWHSLSTGTVGTDSLSFAQTYYGADILQKSPGISGVDCGINVGPGTDLVHRSAGGRPFTLSGMKRVITYSLQGNIQNGTRYMWPGLQTTLDTIQSFYRLSYDTCVKGINVVCRNPPGTATLTITVLWTVSGRPGYGIATPMKVSFTDGTISASYSSTTLDFKAGAHIGIQVDSTGNISSADMTVEVILY